MIEELPVLARTVHPVLVLILAEVLLLHEVEDNLLANAAVI